MSCHKDEKTEAERCKMDFSKVTLQVMTKQETCRSSTLSLVAFNKDSFFDQTIQALLQSFLNFSKSLPM